MFVRVRSHGRRPLELRVIPNEGTQLVVGDVKGGELGRISFLFGLLLGTLLALALASFLLWLILCSWFTTLRHYHYRLRGSSDIILQSRVFVCPPIQFFHGGRWVEGKGLEERSSQPKAPSEVL